MGHSDSLPLTRLSDELLADLRDQFALTAAEHDERASFPHANFKQLGALNLLALTVPVAHGGLGGGLADAARVVGAVGAGEASTGLLLAMNYLMHHTLGRNPPAGYGAIAHAAVEGRGILNALQAEPDLGSAIRGGLPGTVATQQPDGSWRISGRKAYATGSPIVHWWLVLARTGPDDAPRVGTVLVPGNAAGLKVNPTWNHTGLRATASHEIVLDEVVVPATNVLGFSVPGSPEAKARRAVVEVWNGVLIAALYDGIARAGRDWLHRFLHQRRPSSLGATLATVPRLQAIVGEIDTLLLVNRTLIHDAGHRADAAAMVDPLHAQQIKQVVTGNAIHALELALSATGNHGLDRANPLQRHYRDALCGRVHAPQSDVVLLNAGKAALGV
ncbi:acyl-CoA dehydrogenase family protein [Variovorax sp. J2P1-59]|uniref:acyl-CoA dehydrogenase family protein n=1 Tax=Variovorax flavidus TaxID=3053501 RepID=UPI002576FFC5|nr:acyl-CoA dehydrogenase family protein [Variovorax sp. J2P1-59]MDM0078123.1 acyl-CoA dehydrogenase family protein [Variovorax sp. J2P1-59]